MTHGPDDLAAARQHFPAGLLLEVMSERVISGDEEPRLSSGSEYASRQRVTIGPRVIGPVHEIRRAFCAGEQRCPGTRTDRDLVLFAHDVTDRQRDSRVWHIDDHVHTFNVEPAPGAAGPGVGLVPTIARRTLGLALRLLAAVFNRQLRRNHRARSLEVGINA